MNVIAIVSSPRKDGNTAHLVGIILKVLESKFETEKIFLKDYDIRPCEGCHYCNDTGKCTIQDDLAKLYPKLEEASVIILSSPSHMGGVTSRMKAFMERTWFLRKGQLEGKIGSYIVVGRRKIGVVVLEMEEYLSRLRLTTVPGVLGYAYEKGDILKDEEALRETERLGRHILRLYKNRNV